METNKFSPDYNDKAVVKNFPRFLDSRMNESNKPDIKMSEIIVLSIDTMTGLVECLSNLLFPKGLDASESGSPVSSEIDELPIKIPFPISKMILSILAVLLDKASRDISVQSLLNSMQIYINMSGEKKMRKERDAFIRELCIFAVSSDLDDKHILACKTLFNVAHCMPDILEAESWRIIMNAMHKIDKLLQKHLDKDFRSEDKPNFSEIRRRVSENVLNNPAVSEKYKEEIEKKKLQTLPSHQIIMSLKPSLVHNFDATQKLQKMNSEIVEASELSTGTPKLDHSVSETIEDTNADLEILKSALDSLFTSTFMYNDIILIEFLKGLGKLTINMLEDNGTRMDYYPQSRSSNASELSTSHTAAKSIIPIKRKETAIFGIVRILEITLINMNRIELIWDTVVMNELALISSCRHEWLTSIAMEAI